MREQFSRGGGRAAALNGTLGEIGLPSLLTLLEMERRSGVIEIRRRGGRARLALREGQVVQAATRGACTLTGREAVFEMLRWPAGRFAFWVADVVGRDEVGSSTAHLLLDAARLSDELAA